VLVVIVRLVKVAIAVLCYNFKNFGYKLSYSRTEHATKTVDVDGRRGAAARRRPTLLDVVVGGLILHDTVIISHVRPAKLEA